MQINENNEVTFWQPKDDSNAEGELWLEPVVCSDSEDADVKEERTRVQELAHADTSSLPALIYVSNHGTTGGQT